MQPCDFHQWIDYVKPTASELSINAKEPQWFYISQMGQFHHEKMEKERNEELQRHAEAINKKEEELKRKEEELKNREQDLEIQERRGLLFYHATQ